jgi:hypothetical protein
VQDVPVLWIGHLLFLPHSTIRREN